MTAAFAGPAVGIAVTLLVAIAYALVAGFLYACARLETLPQKNAAAPQPTE